MAYVSMPKATQERMISLRRDLHRNPELSWGESRTAERIETELRALGLTPRRVAETGIVAELPGLQEGPFIALRADTDALPIQEETGLEFASERPGVMHACAHDGHTAMLVGAAELLLADPPPLPIRLLFQPAEEVAEGAKAMIKAGTLEGVARIFGGHIDRHYPAGTIALQAGAMNASTDTFEISIRGQDGHGARPHEAVDAIVVGSLLVTALQTIVSREVDPAHPSVVTIGRFSGGTAPNVIAGRAELSGTIRAQHATVREHLHRSIERIAGAIGTLHAASVTVEITEGTPPLLNDAPMAEIARAAALAVCGEQGVYGLRTANMGGEDFACYLDHAPGAYVRFGAVSEGRGGHPAHSSRFDFDERALVTGAAYFDRVAREAARRLLAEGEAG